MRETANAFKRPERLKLNGVLHSSGLVLACALLASDNPLVAIARVPGDDAGDASARIAEWMHAAGRPIKHLVLDDLTDQLLDEGIERLETLDVHALHRMLPEASPPWRAISLHGRPAGDTYEVRARPPAAFDPQVFSSTSLAVRTRPSGDGAYIGELNLRAGLSEFRVSSLVDALPRVAASVRNRADLARVAPRFNRHLTSLVDLGLSPDGLHMRWRDDAPYAALSRFFASLGPLFQLTARAGDAELRMTSEDRRFYFRGAPLPEDARILVDVRVATFGLITEVRGLPIRLQSRRDGDSFRAHLQLQDGAAVEVSGSAFGVVPGWAIDWFIPGDRKTLVERFLTTLVHGNQRRGAWLEIAVVRDEASTLSISGAAELLDNALIRWGMRLMRRRVWPSDAAWADLVAMTRTGYDAVVDDFVAAKECEPIE